jgi:hypothetical protein
MGYIQSVQTVLFSHLLHKSLNIKMYKTIALLVSCGCETWSLTLRKERRLRVFENRVLRECLDLREGKWQDTGEVFIMRIFITCMLHQILG